MSEICVKTSEIASSLPDILKPSFQDLATPATAAASPAKPLTNGTFKSKIKRQRYDSDDDEDSAPEVRINGIHRLGLQDFSRKMDVVRQHLQSLADDCPVFIRPANGHSSEDLNKDDEEWTVNLFGLRQFIQRRELERIIDRKYGEEALRIVRIVAEKAHVDPDQVPHSTL
jgi:hypothetical protein